MEKPNNSVLKRIVDILGILETVTKSEMDLRDLVLTTGWDLDELAGFNLNDLSAALSPLSADLQALLTYIEQPPDSFSKINEAFDKAQSAFARLGQLKNALENVHLEGPGKDKLLEFGTDLLNILVTIYLRTHSPIAFYILYLLTIVDFDDSDLQPIANPGGKLVRYPCLVPKMKPGRLSDIFTNSVEYFGQYYFPKGLQTDRDALAAAHKLFPRIAHILHELGINTQMGFNSKRGVDLGVESNELANGMFTIFFEPNFEGIDFGLSMIFSPASRANLGLVMIPFGSLSFSRIIAGLQFNFDLTAGTKGFALGPEGATLLADAASTQIKLSLKVTTPVATNGEPAFLLGGRSGSRLEIGTLSFEAGLSLDDAKYDIEFLLQAGKAMFVLKPGDGDGLLAKVLPPKGIELDFDLGLGWSSRSGLYFKGGAGMEIEYHFHQSFLGILKLQAIRLKLSLSPTAISFITDAVLEVKLGPVTGIIHQVGVQTITSFVKDGGNVGIANTRIAFKPPSGVGLVIDTGGVKGGGFLKFDPEIGEYSGAIELDIKGMFSLNAIGIIRTRDDNGNNLFSLLILITAEFQPIQLGFGFTLNGVGGLLALNRTSNVQYLQEGLTNNVLDNILFPKDVVANMSRIISGLASAFPIADNHFVVGLMAKIAWGTPAKITADIGIILDLPDTRILLVGVLRANFPSEKNAILKLKAAFIGVLDFKNQFIYFRVDLVDSRILTFKLTGSIVLGICWGEPSVFVLSAGGFNPRFKEIPTLPTLPNAFSKLQRIGIQLLDSDNPRILVEAYFAVTSNTVQFGGKAEFLYDIFWDYNIYGKIEVHALFQFTPFHFIFDLDVQIGLRDGTSWVMGILINGTLEGPTPWHLKATATAKMPWWCPDIEVDLEMTWGDKVPALPAQTALLYDQVKSAITDTRNWNSALPAGNFTHVTFRQPETLPATGEGAAAPEMIRLAPNGLLKFSQSIAPLDFTLQKFGEQVPDISRFSIKSVKIGSIEAMGNEVRDLFSADTFIKMTTDERLSRPSFERMKSGFEVSDSANALRLGPAESIDVTGEISEAGSKKFSGSKPKIDFSNKFGRLVRTSSATYRSPASGDNKLRSGGYGKLTPVMKGQYVVANKDDLKNHFAGKTFGSFAEADEERKKQPLLMQKKLQVVDNFEVA